MKKFRTRIAAVAAMSFAATFAVAALPSQAEDVTLKLVMAAYTDDMVDYYDGLAQDFENANPGIKVEVDVVAWPEIGQKVKTLIASGQTPDIVNNDEFAGEAAAGLLYRADQIVSAAVLKDIIPAFLDNSKYKGTAYAVPDLASARAFFWNKQLISGAGVKAAPK
ncbi:MAG: extracellular solute-binding protein, partial [Actinomycetota bacterium]